MLSGDTKEWFRDINGRIHTIVKNPNNCYCYFLTAWQRLLCSNTIAEYIKNVQCEKKREMINMILYSLKLYSDINESNIQEKIKLFTEFTEDPNIFSAHEGGSPNGLIQYYFLPVIYKDVVQKDNNLMLKILDEVSIYTSALSFSLSSFGLTKPAIFSFITDEELNNFEQNYYNVFYNEFLIKNKENIRCEKFVSACLEIWQGENKTGFGHVVPLILDENKDFVIIDDIRTCEYLNDFVSRKSLNWYEMYIDHTPKDLLEKYNIEKYIGNNKFTTTLCNCKIVRSKHNYSLTGGGFNKLSDKNKLVLKIIVYSLIVIIIIIIIILCCVEHKQFCLTKYVKYQCENCQENTKNE